MSALPAAKRDLAGLGARELGHFNGEIGLLVEAMRADDRQFPGEGAGLLHRNAYGLRAAVAGGDRRERQDDCGSQQRANEKFHYS